MATDEATLDDRADVRRRVRDGYRRWFRTPPRRHGEVWHDREVSFLELFYDLVYVVVISQVSHHLAAHLGWRGVIEFAIVFTLIWQGWVNGTLWHELHGRDDGRSRGNIFVQMILLTLLAVFAGDATGGDGAPFAVVYALLFLWMTWQWFTVRRIDDDERYRPVTARYLTLMVVTVVAVGASAAVDDDLRIAIWGVIAVSWIVVGTFLVAMDRSAGFGSGVTHSLVERYGLITIIVLGEVVIGVVDGIQEAERRGAQTIAVGVVGLTIGMGLWWNYFDLLGRRVPRRLGVRLSVWMTVHLPLAMSITASGAALAILVGYGKAAHAPAGPTWLLCGSVSIVLAAIAVAVQSLTDDEFGPHVRAQVAPTFAVGIVAILAVALIRPSPLALVILVSSILALTWFWLFTVFLARGTALLESDGAAVD